MATRQTRLLYALIDLHIPCMAAGYSIFADESVRKRLNGVDILSSLGFNDLWKVLVPLV